MSQENVEPLPQVRITLLLRAITFSGVIPIIPTLPYFTLPKVLLGKVNYFKARDI